jgi:hypothetical protein
MMIIISVNFIAIQKKQPKQVAQLKVYKVENYKEKISSLQNLPQRSNQFCPLLFCFLTFQKKIFCPIIYIIGTRKI